MERRFYAEYFELEDRHWWFVGRRAILLSLLDRRLGNQRDLRLLDFGCGTGTMAQHLSKYGTVEAVDTDEDAVAFCRQRGLSRVRHLAGPELPFGDGHFDVATALDVLEHIEDDLAALIELRRVLRPKGTLLCAVPAFPVLWGQQDEISRHFRRYRRPELTAMVHNAGFSVLRASYFNTVLFPPIAAIRLGRRLLPRPREVQSDFRQSWPAVNRALARLFTAEAGVIQRTDLPFGVSLVALCERKA